MHAQVKHVHGVGGHVQLAGGTNDFTAELVVCMYTCTYALTYTDHVFTACARGDLLMNKELQYASSALLVRLCVSYFALCVLFVLCR